MTFRALSLSSALCACLLAGLATAQSLDDVQSSNDLDVGTPPVSASVGSVLTITGSGFGTAKPKVYLTNEAGKKFILKVTEFDDIHIVAEIKKAEVGDLTLNVQLKGVTDPLTAAVTVEQPTIEELKDAAMTSTITSADVNTEFVIMGSFFGSKKGKVKIGGKAAKVLEWADDMIHVVMPKTLPNGLQDILLDNKVGVDSDDQITTTASTLKIGKASLTVTIGTGQDAETIVYKYTGADSDAGFIAFGGTTAGFPIEVTGIVIPFDIDNDAAPAHIDSDLVMGMTITFSKTLKGPSKFVPGAFSSWLVSPLGAPGFVVDIDQSSGGQCHGTFTADLPNLVDGIGLGPATLHMTGEFVYEAPKN